MQRAGGSIARQNKDRLEWSNKGVFRKNKHDFLLKCQPVQLGGVALPTVHHASSSRVFVLVSSRTEIHRIIHQLYGQLENSVARQQSGSLGLNDNAGASIYP